MSDHLTICAGYMCDICVRNHTYIFMCIHTVCCPALFLHLDQSKTNPKASTLKAHYWCTDDAIASLSEWLWCTYSALDYVLKHCITLEVPTGVSNCYTNSRTICASVFLLQAHLYCSFCHLLSPGVYQPHEIRSLSSSFIGSCDTRCTSWYVNTDLWQACVSLEPRI